ncbi:MAG: hypothetical protein JWQ01_1703, partial [Massilia sp.]|nr:hypothetical protein [Massilia sp.]
MLETSFYAANLSRSKWRRCRGGLADFEAAEVGLSFEQCRLVGADLRRFSFRKARLAGLDFQDADLSGCDFRQAVFEESSLRNAHLKDARFDGADLRGADIAGIKLGSAAMFK